MTHEERAQRFLGCEVTRFPDHSIILHSELCRSGIPGRLDNPCEALIALLASVAAEERERIRGAIHDRAGMVWYNPQSEKEAGRRFGLDEALGAIDPKEPQAPKSAAIRKGE